MANRSAFLLATILGRQARPPRSCLKSCTNALVFVRDSDGGLLFGDTWRFHTPVRDQRVGCHHHRRSFSRSRPFVLHTFRSTAGRPSRTACTCDFMPRVFVYVPSPCIGSNARAISRSSRKKRMFRQSLFFHRCMNLFRHPSLWLRKHVSIFLIVTFHLLRPPSSLFAVPLLHLVVRRVPFSSLP